jgi:hypothetical protein
MPGGGLAGSGGSTQTVDEPLAGTVKSSEKPGERSAGTIVRLAGSGGPTEKTGEATAGISETT